MAGNVLQEILTRIGFTVDQGSMDKAKSAASSLQGWLLKLTSGISVAMVGRMALNSASQMETLKAQFTTMLGNNEATAERFFGKISQFAASTPFEQMGVAQAAQTLMQFGVETEKVMPTLAMLGDVAGADQFKFKQLSLVFGQIMSTGRLMGQDLMQLINAGFNPLQVISKKTGRSMADLKADMEKGKISAEMVTDAFKSATSAGGQFYQNTANQAKTWQGVTSTAMDTITMGLGNAMMKFMPVMKSIVAWLGDTDLTWLETIAQSAANSLTLIGQELEKSGIIEAWELFRYQIGTLGEELGLFLGGPGQGTAGFLRSLAGILAFVANAFLYTSVFVMELVKAFLWLLPSLNTTLSILQVLGPALLILYSPALIASIWAKVAAMAAEGGMLATLKAGYLASILVSGGQLTLNGLLTASWWGMTAAIGAAATAMKAFVLSNPLLLVAAAAAAAVAWAWMRINEAMDRYLEDETRAAEDRAVADLDASYANQMKKRAELRKELKDLSAQGQGSTQRAQDLEKEIAQQDSLIRINRKARDQYTNDINKARKERSGEMPDFTASLEMQNSQAVLDMQKATQGQGKNVKVENNMDFTINAPAGKNGETGLTASGIGAAAKEAFRAQFSIELQKVLVGAV